MEAENSNMPSTSNAVVDTEFCSKLLKGMVSLYQNNLLGDVVLIAGKNEQR